MKQLNTFPLCLFLPFCILLAVILVLILSRSAHITYTTESFSESTDYLANPFQGFYHIIGYTLSDSYDPANDFPRQADGYTDPLALVEINLKNYSGSEISETGLKQLEDIFSSWAASSGHTRLILRFLYDWDGVAFSSEPASRDLVLTHMDQVSTLVNKYHDCIYVMQGIFVGNWGEMNGSSYLDETSIRLLIGHLHEIIDPSIYLSVRTPSHWRIITDRYDLPATFPAFGADDSLMGRLGLYNDGILGSVSDLGTYGDTARRDATSPAYKGTREEELRFQNRLCQYVPNGGEVIFNQTLSNDLKTSADALKTMHISYLNADYDGRVMESWKNSSWDEKDAFYGCSGYDYIKAHLGYRYLIRNCKIRKTGWLFPKVSLTLTMENHGFSNTLKPFQTQLLLKNKETGACTVLPVNLDLRQLGSGQKRSFTVQLPVKDLEKGSYQIYVSVTDEASGQMILLGNKNEQNANGCLAGTLEK